MCVVPAVVRVRRVFDTLCPYGKKCFTSVVTAVLNAGILQLLCDEFLMRIFFLDEVWFCEIIMWVFFISIKTILCENQGQVSKQGWPDFGYKLGQKTTHGAKHKQSTVYRVIKSSDQAINAAVHTRSVQVHKNKIKL